MAVRTSAYLITHVTSLPYTCFKSCIIPWIVGHLEFLAHGHCKCYTQMWEQKIETMNIMHISFAYVNAALFHGQENIKPIVGASGLIQVNFFSKAYPVLVAEKGLKTQDNINTATFLTHKIYIITHVFKGERNGRPLQYFCLENSMGEEPGGLRSMRLQRVRNN